MQHIQLITLATLLPFIGVLTATLVMVLRGIGTSKASMEDIYDRWSYSNQQETAAADKDQDYAWLNEHELICPKTLGGMSRDQGVPTMHRICPECKDLQRLLWGIHPIRTPEMIMPDFVDPRKATKEAFAKITTLHPERAA